MTQLGGERLSRSGSSWVPPSVIDRRSRRMERCRQGQELPREAAGRGGAFHGSAPLPSFVLSLDLELGTKGALGQRPAQPWEQRREPGEAASITTGEGIELKFLLGGRAGCCSHGTGADPALPGVFSPRGRGCRLLFSHFPSF